MCPEKTASNNPRKSNAKPRQATTEKSCQTTAAKPRKKAAAMPNQSAANPRQTKAGTAKPLQTTTTKRHQTTGAKTKVDNQSLPNTIAALSHKLSDFGKRCLPWAKTKKNWLLLLLLFLLGFAIGVWRSAALRIQSPAAASVPLSTGVNTAAAPQASPKTLNSVETSAQPLSELSNLMQQQTAGFDARLAEAIRESSAASLKTVNSSEFVRPCPGRVTETFGWKRDNSMSAWNLHAGVFLASPSNASIVAIAGGQVARIEHNTLHGTLITIDHDSHWRSVYGHLSEVSVAASDPVTAGQVIGRVGPGPEGAEGLYFAVYHDGEPQDPQMLIPGL